MRAVELPFVILSKDVVPDNPGVQDELVVTFQLLQGQPDLDSVLLAVAIVLILNLLVADVLNLLVADVVGRICKNQVHHRR